VLLTLHGCFFILARWLV